MTVFVAVTCPHHLRPVVVAPVPSCVTPTTTSPSWAPVTVTVPTATGAALDAIDAGFTDDVNPTSQVFGVLELSSMLVVMPTRVSNCVPDPQ